MLWAMAGLAMATDFFYGNKDWLRNVCFSEIHEANGYEE